MTVRAPPSSLAPSSPVDPNLRSESSLKPEVRLKNGASVSAEEFRQTLDALVELEMGNRFALCELTMHCRDRGHPIPIEARRTLANEPGILGQYNGLVSEGVRNIVRSAVTGHGLRMHIQDPVLREGERPIDSVNAWAQEKQAAPPGFARELVATATQMAGSGKKLDARQMSRWAAAAATLTDDHGRATAELQGVITEVDRKLSKSMSRGAKPIFQEMVAMVGAKLEGNIAMPRNRTPYWLIGPHPLANHQSTKDLPREADVVIIGAGLTGASAAYHLSKDAEKGLGVVVLDAHDPGTAASGMNGGHFLLIPENFKEDYGSYDGLPGERYKFLKEAYPDLPEKVLRRHAKRIAETIIRFSLRNAKRIRQTVEKEGIDCDLSPAGWLRTALNPREAKAIRAEVKLAKELGADVRVMLPKTIEKKLKFPAKYLGRIVENNGNYHPFKLVCGELQRAIGRGVKLYTRTPVVSVRSECEDCHWVETERGIIRAKKVIVATNAYTPELFPQLSDIRPFRSQLLDLEHVEDDLHGMSITAKDGDIYVQAPGQERYVAEDGVRRGMLHVGGGKDADTNGSLKPSPSRRVYQMSLREIAEHFPHAARQPASRLWAGSMAFVEGKRGMRIPALGPLGPAESRGVFIAVWCNGYGGTGCHETGAGAASWARSGEVPRSMPQDVFGVARLFQEEPLFDTK